MIKPFNNCVLLKREKKDDKYFTLQQDNCGIVEVTNEDADIIIKEGVKVYFNKIVGEVGEFIVVNLDDIIAYERD